MLRGFDSGWVKAGLAVAVVSALGLGIATAQGNGQRRGPGQRGPAGQMGQLGPRHPMGPPPMLKKATAINVPVHLYNEKLGLSAEQLGQVMKIIDATHQQIRDLLPPPPEPGATPPDPATMQAIQAKIAEIEKGASAQIVALLNATQQAKLARLIQDMNDFRIVAFPPPAVDQMQLTDAQMAKLDTIAEQAWTALAPILAQGPPAKGSGDTVREKVDAILRQAHEAALAVLTDDQKAILEQFPPHRGPGGPHGPGGPGGPDGFGPPPPPPGGPDDGMPPPPPGGPAEG